MAGVRFKRTKQNYENNMGLNFRWAVFTMQESLQPIQSVHIQRVFGDFGPSVRQFRSMQIVHFNSRADLLPDHLLIKKSPTNILKLNLGVNPLPLSAIVKPYQMESPGNLKIRLSAI